MGRNFSDGFKYTIFILPTHRLNQEQTMTKTFQQALDDSKRRLGNPPRPITFNRGLTTYSIYTRIDMTVRRENLLTLNNWVNSVKGAVKEATLPIESSFAVGHPLKEPGTFTQPVITGIYDIYGKVIYVDGSEVE